MKENQTYDQVLGDLEKGNSDPASAMFTEPYTRNQHQIARQFITLDNFYDSGEVGGVGSNRSTAARATDYVDKTVFPSYAGRLGRFSTTRRSVASRWTVGAFSHIRYPGFRQAPIT